MQNSIHQLVREAEDNFLNGSVSLSQYVDWSMHDTIETVDAYYNSKFTSGSEDSLGRPKPFFNICTAAVNVWYRATDLDRKNIRIIPDKSSNTALAFIANVLLQQWMKDSRFGVFLNEWGRTLAKYGSAVVKFVEQDGELHASVVPWNRFIADPIDFNAIPRVEKLYYTPSQLRKHPLYDKEQVELLIETAQESRETLDGETKDNKSDFIEVYEVHGELPLSNLTDKEEDNETFVQQMHVIAYSALKGSKTEYNDFSLYRGRESKDPYMLTHLIPEEGRTLAIGAVESLFEAQWMANHSIKNEKDTLDLSTKLFFQTPDTNFQGRNVLTQVEVGEIFTHKENMPITQVNNTKSDIVQLQNFRTSWLALASEITSTPDAIKGQTLPSGTPYSLGAFLGAQANSLFEIMTENKGLQLEEMMRTFVLPHLKTKMDSKDEIVAILDEQSITEIDAMYIPREAVKRYNKRTAESIFELAENPNAPIPSPFQQEVEEQGVKESLAPLGNKRFFKPDEVGEKTWKEALKDLEMELIVEVTNENTDKQATLTTLATIFQTVAGNPAVLQDPNAKMLFNAILKETNVISPIQLSTSGAQQVPSAAPPTTGGLEGLATKLDKAQ